MSRGSYKYQRRSTAIIVTVVILVIVYLLGVTSYDAFVSSPKKAKRMEIIHQNFSEMKTYLDNKLPEIDSALILHEKQIEDQNKQLEELNRLTEVLKEDNPE